jgi:hypothetical protein
MIFLPHLQVMLYGGEVSKPRAANDQHGFKSA